MGNDTSNDERLTPSELEDVIMALRGQAHIARQDAAAHAGATTQDLFIAKAARLDALIAKFERVAKRRRRGP